MLAGANWVPDFSAFDDRRLPYVYNPEVKVLDDDGKVLQDFFPYSQTLGGVVLSSGGCSCCSPARLNTKTGLRLGA